MCENTRTYPNPVNSCENQKLKTASNLRSFIKKYSSPRTRVTEAKR